ncbi:hypothetical protein ACQR5W_18605 [Xanthomonas sacchari]|uniref:hypothetical protein n=1 Tax=Xanthomonas sp. SHU 308 TaxID=1591201 RepID=UPI000370668E|nr:hypothetical protein [Xanthomonas sp. SHU 308]
MRIANGAAVAPLVQSSKHPLSEAEIAQMHQVLPLRFLKRMSAMRAKYLSPSRLVPFLVIFGISANAMSATPVMGTRRTLADVATCRVEDASRKEHPPVLMGFMAEAGIKGTALVDVSLGRGALGAAAGEPIAAEADSHAEVGGLKASDVQVQRSTRNRDLDRIALQTASKWRYVCPSGVPDAQRWARVEIAMDPALNASDGKVLPRFAIDSFPSWFKAMLMQPGALVATSDDSLMPAGRIEEIAARVQSDPAFKKDEVPKPFTMYATWDEQAQTSQIWWLSDERQGRANAVVLIRDNYRAGTRTYAVRCASSARLCAAFDQWLQSIIGTWYPMATWDAAPSGAKRP